MTYFDRLTPRLSLALVAAFALAAMLTAVFYFQRHLGLAPCPLCVLQRVALILAGVAALVGAAAAQGAIAQRIALACAASPALAGAGIAAWHSWILVYPPESMSCGRPFQWLHDEFPLAEWLPRLFRGDGDCLSVEWSLFGLGIPQWSLLAFIFVLALGWRQTRRDTGRA